MTPEGQVRLREEMRRLKEIDLPQVVKDIGTVWEQQLPHRVRDLAAFVEENATNRETLEHQLSFAMKTAPKLTIQGGTTEVLRGIIARGLGLR